MADISMCSGEGCPLKDNCYRATATPSMRQWWFIPPPIVDGDCEYQIPLTPTIRVVHSPDFLFEQEAGDEPGK